MDINELESFKMSDAIKFHDELNPNLWNNDKLDPQVRKQLLLIAEDFITTLGIKDLAVKDITVSGSNAAYTYTPHSDLDLHILVDFNELPNNEVYQELFNAKKIIYNDSHDITVHGVPVELYVQDTNLPVVSLGEYSVLNDKWIRIPKKQRANLDQDATRAKFDKLAELVDLALQTRDPARVSKTLDTIKRYRKAGLAKGGEFSPENLAFKAIRKQGGIQDLYDLKNELHSEKLSIEEAASREDAILKIKKLRNLKGRTPNEVENVKRIVTNLMKQWNIDPAELGIKQKVDPLQAKIAKAAYEKNAAANMFKQEWERFKKGIFAEEETVNELFNKPYDTQSKDDENYPDDWHYEFTTADGSKYVVTIFDPYDYPMIAFAQLKDGEYVDDTTNTGDAFKIFATVGEIIKKFVDDMEPDQFSFAGVVDDPSRLKLYDRIAQHIQRVSPDYKNMSINNNARFTGGKTGKEYIFHRSTVKKNPDMDEDYDPNGPPPGPEFKPTMPAGTVRVDVSDVYDWYKLGQHISNMKGLGKHDFGKGPPSTILSFGDEDTEHEYIQDLEKTGLSTTDIDPVDPNQPKGMKRQKTDPTFNVNETDSRTAAVLKIQKHLNKKYGANLDLDGKLGPLTLKSINKFMPRASKGLADEPNKTTAVQGKKLKEAKIDAHRQGDTIWINYFEVPEKGKGLGTQEYMKFEKSLPKDIKKIRLVASDAGYGPTHEFWDRMGFDYAYPDDDNEMVKLLEAPRTFQSQVTPLEKLIQDYGYFTSFGTVHLDKQVTTPDGQQQLLSLVQRLQKDSKAFNGLDKQKMEANRDTILNHIHQMMQYAIPILKKHLPAEKWEAKRGQINSVLTAYNNARQINEASGYIPSEKEKNDPRFLMALTKDVRPDANKKNAKAFGWKVSRAGIPPQARADGKIAESLMNEWKAFLAEEETLTKKQFYPKQIRQQYLDPNKPWATGEYQNKDQRLGGTEQLPKPIHDYVGTSFGLNKSLVNQKSITGLVQNLVRRLKGGQSYSQPIKDLDALLAKSLMPQDTIVYHGTHKFNPGELAAKGAGKITIPSYLSTSTDKNVAYHFSGARYGDGHIIEISLKKGQPAYNIGGSEGEVLLPRNTTLQIDPDPTELPGQSFLWHAQIVPKSVTEDPSAPTILD